MSAIWVGKGKKNVNESKEFTLNFSVKNLFVGTQTLTRKKGKSVMSQKSLNHM